MRELALFAGAGGGILGGYLLGWECVCAVEIEDYPRRVLLARQRDGILPQFPIWDDIRTFDGTAWRGRVDIITGGFPCQDISIAGKRAGITGERSGLWTEMARVICEVQPRFVLVENSPMLTIRGLGVVLGNLAALGYDAQWGVLGACHAGAPHRRERIWIVADADGQRFQELNISGIARKEEQYTGNDTAPSWWSDDPADMADAAQNGCNGPYWEDEEKKPFIERQYCSSEGARNRKTWSTQPRLGRVAHGVADRVDRLAAIGNGQVPAVVRLAWHILSEDGKIDSV